MRRLFEGGGYSSNYCNWQLESLLHLGQIVITFSTLLHLGKNVIIHLGLQVFYRALVPFSPSVISNRPVDYPSIYPAQRRAFCES